MIAHINEWLAIKTNRVFATMYFAYFCFILVSLPLVWPATMPYVQYISSGVIQLVALPLLGVGTLLAARSTDRQSAEQHDAVMGLVVELHAMHLELQEKWAGSHGSGVSIQGADTQP